jgi:hypothetical protein
MATYNSLSDYLDNKLQVNSNEINEGLFDWLKKSNGKQPSKEETKKAGILTGCLGAFLGIFGGKTSDNKLMNKYAEIMKNEEADELARLKKEQEAEEALEIEKLEAEYEHNKAQMDLASKRRVDAFKAAQARIKELKNRTKEDYANGKTILYTREQNEQLINTIRTTGKDLGLVEGNPLSRMADLALLIGTDNEGNPRSYEEIQAEIKKGKDSPIAQYIEEYNKLGKKHGKILDEGMTSTAFAQQISKNINAVNDQEKLDKQERLAQEDVDNYTAVSDIVTKVKAVQKKYNDANTAYGKAVEELNNAVGTQDKPNPFAKGYNEETGKVEELKPEEFKDAIKDLAADASKFTKENGEFDEAKFRSRLEKLGIPGDVINSMSDTTPFKPDATKIKDAIDGLSEDQLNTAIKATKTETEKSIASAKATVKSKKVALDKTVNLEDPDMSVEDKINKMRELGLPEAEALCGDAIPNFSTYNDMSATDKELFDPTTEAGKAEKDSRDKKLEDAKKESAKNRVNKEANKRACKDAHAREMEGQRTRVPEELAEDVEKFEDGLEPGEVYGTGDNAGKIGFYKDGKFIPKPGPQEKNKNEDYIAARDKHLMTMDLSTIEDGVDSQIKSMKKNADGTYTIEYESGDIIDDVSKEDAAKAKANQRQMTKTKEIARDRRHELATSLKDCIKDGKLDRAKFKALLDSDDIKTKTNKEALLAIINGDVKTSDYFAGIDLDGDITLNEIDGLFKDNIDSLKKEIDNFEDDEYSRRDKNNDGDDNDEYEDVEDDDEDANDEKEYDSDEDEEVTDEHGNTTTQKKKLKNPAKIWKRKKRKNGKGMTKAYYSKDEHGNDISISAKEYKDKMDAYKKAKQKAQQQAGSSSFHYTNLGNHLFESINGVEITVKTYTKLSKYLLNNVN